MFAAMACAAAAGQNTLVRSIQQGEIDIATSSSSNTATPSPTIDKNYTIPFFRNLRVGASITNNRDEWQPRLELTSSTVLTAATHAASSTGNRIVSYALLHLWPFAIRHTSGTPHVQHGTITITNGNATAEVTPSFTPVVDANTFCQVLGVTTDQTTQHLDRTQGEVRYDFAANKVKADRGTDNTSGAITISFVLWEFNPGIVKSKQEVLVTTNSGAATGTASITAAPNSLSIYGWYQSTGAFQQEECSIRQNSSTQYTSQRQSTAALVNKQRVTVCEFHPKWIKSMQRINPIFGSAETAHDETITSVDTAKSLVNWLGHWQLNEFANINYNRATAKLQSATAVRLDRTSVSSTREPTVSIEVPEFY